MKTPTIVCAVALVCSPAAFAAGEKPAREEKPKTEEKVDVAAQLEAEKRTLATMLAQFRERHPRVIEQRQKIARLEKQLAIK